MSGICAARCPGRRGLTLVELLAVVVIISLVASLTTMGLASSTQAARTRAATAQWQDLDARARAFARTIGPMRMALDDEGTAVSLRCTAGEELLSSLEMPQGATGRILIDGEPQPVLFDGLGRSADYVVELDEPGRVVRWSVCGLTGLIVRKEP